MLISRFVCVKKKESDSLSSLRRSSLVSSYNIHVNLCDYYYSFITMYFFLYILTFICCRLRLKCKVSYFRCTLFIEGSETCRRFPWTTENTQLHINTLTFILQFHPPPPPPWFFLCTKYVSIQIYFHNLELWCGSGSRWPAKPRPSKIVKNKKTR